MIGDIKSKKLVDLDAELPGLQEFIACDGGAIDEAKLLLAKVVDRLVIISVPLDPIEVFYRDESVTYFERAKIGVGSQYGSNFGSLIFQTGVGTLIRDPPGVPNVDQVSEPLSQVFDRPAQVNDPISVHVGITKEVLANAPKSSSKPPGGSVKVDDRVLEPKAPLRRSQSVFRNHRTKPLFEILYLSAHDASMALSTFFCIYCLDGFIH